MKIDFLQYDDENLEWRKRINYLFRRKRNIREN